jgi:hypothetical protein
MKIVILPSARDDLADGFQFWENQEEGLGGYFLESLFLDIDSLILHAGIHLKVFGNHRLLSKTVSLCDLLCKRTGNHFCQSRFGLSQKSEVSSPKNAGITKNKTCSSFLFC